MAGGEALLLFAGQKSHLIKRKKEWSWSPESWLLVQTLSQLLSGQPAESLGLSFFISMGRHSLPHHRADFCERAEQGCKFLYLGGHGEESRAALLLFGF